MFEGLTGTASIAPGLHGLIATGTGSPVDAVKSAAAQPVR
jgi:hypothetical protein